jgi:hypothetical protein
MRNCVIKLHNEEFYDKNCIVRNFVIELHSEEPCYSCPSRNIILVIIPRTVKLAGRVERGGGEGKCLRDSVGKA